MIFPVLLMKFLVFVVIRLVMLTSVARLTSDEVSFQLHKVDLPQELWILVTSSSLYDFKVVQYCHDVLGHEDVAGVQGHPHNRHQHRIEHGSLPGLQHVERSDQQVLVVEPGHLLPCSRQRHARHAPPAVQQRQAGPRPAHLLKPQDRKSVV